MVMNDMELGHYQQRSHYYHLDHQLIDIPRTKGNIIRSILLQSTIGRHLPVMVFIYNLLYHSDMRIIPQRIIIKTTKDEITIRINRVAQVDLEDRITIGRIGRMLITLIKGASLNLPSLIVDMNHSSRKVDTILTILNNPDPLMNRMRNIQLTLDIQKHEFLKQFLVDEPRKLLELSMNINIDNQDIRMESE